MEKKHIEKLVEETMNSFDGAQRAAAKPFLLTRILARMKKAGDAQNIWSKASAFLSRPAIAVTGLVLIIVLNATIIIKYTNSGNAVQNSGAVKDDFAINVISIYDLENQEP